MEEIVLHIVERLRAGEQVDDRVLVKLIHAAAKRAGGDKRAFAKRRLLPFYQRIKTEEPERWAAWDITPDIERKLVQVLRMKPRRSASGVATITVITKPWPCSGSCRFCPSDLRMPKSYLADEPACERAAQNAAESEQMLDRLVPSLNFRAGSRTINPTLLERQFARLVYLEKHNDTWYVRFEFPESRNRHQKVTVLDYSINARTAETYSRSGLYDFLFKNWTHYRGACTFTSSN